MNDYQQLLARYGVTTPELRYAGLAQPADGASPEATARYNEDKSAYDDWLAKYKTRVAAGNMYGALQGDLLGAPTYKYGAGYVDPVEKAKAEAAAAEKAKIAGAVNAVNAPVANVSSGYQPAATSNLTDAQWAAVKQMRDEQGWSNPYDTAGLKAFGSAALGMLGGPLGAASGAYKAMGYGNEQMNALNNFMQTAATLTPVPSYGPVVGTPLGTAEPLNVTSGGSRSYADTTPTAVTVPTREQAAAQDQSFADSMRSYESAPASESTYSAKSYSPSSSDSDSSSDSSVGGYARGGRVKRYAQGGLYDIAANYGLSGAPGLNPEAPARTLNAQTEQPEGISGMLQRYQPAPSAYGAELKAAQQESDKQSEAFNKMLESYIKQPGDSAPSKAEMYFQLAAAFGAPTKTGSFGESLGRAGEVLGAHQKAARETESANRRANLQLGLEAQKMRMQGAKENLTSLRQLAGEEMKDKRAITTELIKDYVASGKPQSSAGKQAQDEGLKPGTPEFQKRVGQIADMNVEKQMASINATLANMSVAQANQALAQQKFGFQQEQAAKLTAPEMKLKTDTEDMVAQTQQAMENLKKAYSLNPNTFDASLTDVAQRKVLEAVGSKDTKVQNTREMENLLEKAALSSLKSTFPGAISNDERKALQDVQGLGAKSKEERAKIMQNGYKALKAVDERARKRLNEIKQGQYRDTGSPVGELE